VAMRKKEFGIWREYTWKDYYEKVKHLSLGLITLGFQHGDKLAIIGDNNPEWFWAELAAQAAGGIPTGIVSSCLPAEVEHIVKHSDSTFVVVQDQEQVDKVLRIMSEGKLPLVKKVIYWDPKGLARYEDTILMSFDEVLKLGQELATTQRDLFEQNTAQGKAEDMSIILYTSGTTGLPKGVTMSYRCMIGQHMATTSLNPIYETDEFLSFTLPSWINEQGNALLSGLAFGQILNFPESLDTVPDNFIEISPHVVLYGSKIWEGVTSTAQRKVLEAPFLNRLAYRWAMRIGYKVADLKDRGVRPNILLRILYGLVSLAVFRPLKSKHGLQRVRLAYTGGAILGPDVIKFFQVLGVDIRQLFGLTEGGLISAETVQDKKLGSVGRPVPGVILRLSQDGEILLKTSYSFSGYYKAPEATQKMYRDGWLCTGDAGYFDDDGYLFFIDRLEDMRQIADGTRFSPQYIESRLRFSPYISDAFVLGGKERNFVATIININFDSVGNWAETRHVPYTTFVDLSQKPEVCQLIRQEVERVNRLLPERSRIRRFVNLHKAFDPDEAELTRTMKLRRTFMEDRYRDLVEAVYGEQKELMVKTPVVYRDGRKGEVSALIKVSSLS